jgi:hypothetical protein
MNTALTKAGSGGVGGWTISVRFTIALKPTLWAARYVVGMMVVREA